MLDFAEVNGHMQRIGLRFVGSADVLENHLDYLVTPEFVDMLSAIPDRCMRESMRDFIQNRFFRRDVYIRPPAEEEQTPAGGTMDNVLFGMVISPVEMPDSVKVYGGKLDMAGAWLNRLKQLLARAVLTLPEILADPVLKDCPPQDLIDAVKLLIISGHISPFARRSLKPPDEGTERTRVVPRLNRLLLDRPPGKSPWIVLASPVIGSGIVLNALEAVLLAAVQFLPRLPPSHRAESCLVG